MISDDDLLLYYYRELDAADRARIGAALSEQPALAQRLQTLVARLDAAAAMPEVPVPEHVQQRWKAALEQAANKVGAGGVSTARPRRGFLTDTRWLAVAATVAVVALIAVVRIAMQAPPDQTAEVVAPANPADASAYERGLKWHLASTEQQLASLDSASPEERARLIETIVAQNRIYALAAEKAGEPQLARVLRAFGPILESLEHGDTDTSASVAQLSFELRVMQGRLNASPELPPNSTTL